MWLERGFNHAVRRQGGWGGAGCEGVVKEVVSGCVIMLQHFFFLLHIVSTPPAPPFIISYFVFFPNRLPQPRYWPYEDATWYG